ncbi:hypothetical protein L1887_23864 [Cichorium endivia]|nr:hypothetical protein L1887_23864 [Cichorium endivia]
MAKTNPQPPLPARSSVRAWYSNLQRSSSSRSPSLSLDDSRFHRYCNSRRAGQRKATKKEEDNQKRKNGEQTNRFSIV